MAMISCTECGRQISDRATACPGCACPVGGVKRSYAGVTVIEQTGKKYKGQIALASMMMIGGIAVAILGMMSSNENMRLIGVLGVLGMVVGVIWLGIAKVAAWWSHG